MFLYLRRRLWNLVLKVYSLLIRRHFKRLDSHLDPRVEVTNPEYISIGAGVQMRPYTWLYAMTGHAAREDRFEPSIEIGDGCVIGRFCYITASNRVVIEPKALVMESVLITDSIHAYDRIDVPIIDQPLVTRGPIIIGSGSWIGVGSRIVGTVRIGRNSVVSANSVVLSDVPDYTMVAGAPAKIVKQYDPATGEWRRPSEIAG